MTFRVMGFPVSKPILADFLFGQNEYSSEVASLFVRFLDYSVMSDHSACIDEILYK